MFFPDDFQRLQALSALLARWMTQHRPDKASK